ncbi:Component of IIS longevity pathway SMK-1, putative [Angomonas deanei]|uniref:Component of IIS longevity pathway SMK-1, putative n=1 Tax=Angomonas deanei TaxID=59799 RepID=A0A7G2C436_9TRYP|nr:Component of IIS longevity pathway SMK-1, putative [Angomonas deanei]
MKNNVEFVKQLVALFTVTKEEGNTALMDLIGQITLQLLQSPYSTDASVIAQFVEEASIDKVIDIVQFGLGRRSEETGFVSLEKRRATFRNPLQLKEPILSRIHLIYSAGYLKDMLPLNFEEDVMSPSILGLYLLRFKFSLMSDICASDGLLEPAFSKVMESKNLRLSDFLDLLGLLNDMGKTIKNSVFPAATKEPILQNLIRAGLFSFINRALECALEEYRNLSNSNKPSEEQKCVDDAIQMCCDVVNCCVTTLPSSRQDLLEESAHSPPRCTLNLFMKAIILVRSNFVSRSVLDVVFSCVTPSPFQMSLYFQEQSKSEDIVYFLVNGRVEGKSPLFAVAATVAELMKVPMEESRDLLPSEEVRLVHGLKLLEVLCEALKENLTNSFVELLTLSDLLSSIANLVQVERRTLADAQTAGLSLIAKCIYKGGPHFARLFKENKSLLERVMTAFLKNTRRNNLLGSSLGHVFGALCDRVHIEKCCIERKQGSPANPYFYTVMHGEDSVSKGVPQHSFEEVLTPLKELYSRQLVTGHPILLEWMDRVLQETPEEAYRAETSSVASTTERGLPFEVQMEEFDVDMVGTPFNRTMEEHSARDALSLSPIQTESDDDNSNGPISVKREREEESDDTSEKRRKT